VKNTSVKHDRAFQAGQGEKNKSQLDPLFKEGSARGHQERRPDPEPVIRLRDPFCVCGHHEAHHRQGQGQRPALCSVPKCGCKGYERPLLLLCVSCGHVGPLHRRGSRWGCCTSRGCQCSRWMPPRRPCCSACGHPAPLHQGGDSPCRAMGCGCPLMAVVAAPSDPDIGRESAACQIKVVIRLAVGGREALV
jgi:hypothetical protein